MNPAERDHRKKGHESVMERQARAEGRAVFMDVEKSSEALLRAPCRIGRPLKSGGRHYD